MANELDYYDPRDLFIHMHASTFKNFLFAGEAEALAQMNGTYEIIQDKTALLVGNYLHSYFESKEAHQAFIEEHSDNIIAKSGKYKGQLKSEYRKADAMIKRIEADPIIMAMIENAPKHEEIIEGDLFGIPWRGKLDAVNFDEGYFIDYKTVRTLEKKKGLVGGEWSDFYDGYANFFNARGYHIQMAAYQEMLRQMTGKEFECYIVAVTKEDEPIAKLFKVTDETLARGMDDIERYQPRIEKLINGEEKPSNEETYSRLYRNNYRVHPEYVEVL